MASYIVCPHNDNHDKNLTHGVLCSRCHLPLFKVKWWYHAIVLNLAVITIGFIIGEFRNVWIPGLIIEFLCLIYICILFRKSADDSNFIFLIALEFAISLLAAFIWTFGDLGNSILMVIRTSLPYVIIGVLFVSYGLCWLADVYLADLFSFRKKADDRSKRTGAVNKYIKAFPALSMGFFLLVLLVDWINDREQFLSQSIVSIIKSHIHLRWILLGVSGCWLIVLAFIKSLEHEINVSREFFKPTTEINPWSDEIKEGGIWGSIQSLLRPIVNITQSIYKAITETLKGIANFIVYLVLLALSWLREFLHQCLVMTKETFKLFWEVFMRFMRYFTLPLFVLFSMHFFLLAIPGHLFNQIYVRDGGAVWIIGDAALFVLYSVFLIILLGGYDVDQWGEVVASILVTNLAVGLMVLLYAWIASIALWIAAQWLQELPFKSIGLFPFVVGGAVVLTGTIIFAAEKIKAK